MSALKNLLALVLLTAFLSGTTAFAETPATTTRPETSDPTGFIIGFGLAAFNQSGGAFLPLSVLGALRQGQIAPILQFTLSGNLMTQCLNFTLLSVPAIRAPYTIAKAVFDRGVCQIRKCFEQGRVIQMLPGMSSVVSAGGSADAQTRSTAQSVATSLANSFAGQPGCDGGSGIGFDPAILSAITGT